MCTCRAALDQAVVPERVPATAGSGRRGRRRAGGGARLPHGARAARELDRRRDCYYSARRVPAAASRLCARPQPRRDTHRSLPRQLCAAAHPREKVVCFAFVAFYHLVGSLICWWAIN